MADNENGQEKTEQATPKRLQESRQEGEVARSRELNTMFVMFFSALIFLMFGEAILIDFMDLLSATLTLKRDLVFDSKMLYSYFMDSIFSAIKLLMPIFLFLFFVALIGPLSLGGWVFSPKALNLKLERLDPIKGLQRVFSVRGLVELLKALAKFFLIALISLFLLMQFYDEILALGRQPYLTGMAQSGHLLVLSLLGLSIALVIIAMIDVPFQLWQHGKKLRMTRQEIKDELKQTDGNPEVRGRVRSIQREMARRRMMEEVPRADVIIVNPSHYSVALKYDEHKGGAPILLAKGTDWVALKIRDIARHHQIIIFTAAPLARAIYYSTKLGQEIPSGLYLAVAKVLAYVYQLKIAKQTGQHKPNEPQDLPIPDELKH